MGINDRVVSRRTLLLGASALAALPLGAALAGCATSNSSDSSSTNTPTTTTGTGGASASGSAAPAGNAANPFNVASGSSVDAVIFDGGYGVDYVEYAAKVLGAGSIKATAKVSSSTQIATELQPRFVGGTPPDLVDDSGAGLIGLNTIVDQLTDLTDVIDAPNLEGTTIRDTLYAGVLNPGTINGKLAAINYVLTVYAVWYSASLFEANGWTPPTTWDEAKALGAKAKAAGKYLFVWGKEAATYYQTLIIASAIKEGGDEVRVNLGNLADGCWSQPAVQAAIGALKDCIDAGYVKPGGSGTQFTAAQAQWSQDQSALLYPSGSWIENEMIKATKADFKMSGVPDFSVTSGSKMPVTAVHSAAGEAYIVPSAGANVAGGKELLRTMLSKDAASNFAKTKLSSTVVKGLVPADGFGSTALVSQSTMLDKAGSNIFSWEFVDVYGTNTDMLVPWNSFLEGQMSAADLTSALQKITDGVRNDSSVTKVTVS